MRERTHVCAPYREARLCFDTGVASPEVLPEDAQRNPEALQAYLRLEKLEEEVRRNPQLREQERRRRLRHALAFARSDADKTQRLLVAKTACENLRLELQTVESQLRGDVHPQLKQSAEKRKPEVVQSYNEAEQTLACLEGRQLELARGEGGASTGEKQSFTERVKNTVQDIATDFKEGDWKVRTAYIATGVVGFLAARWIYRKIRSAFTENKEDSFIGKTMKWLASIGGGVLGILGVKKILDYYRNPLNLPGVGGSDKDQGPVDQFFDKKRDNPLIPNVVEPHVEATYWGGKKGLEGAKQVLGPAAEALYQHENVKRFFEEDHARDSDLEYTSKLLWAILKDGGDLAVDETGVLLHAGGRLITLEGRFGKNLWNYLADGEFSDMEELSELWATYVEGVFVYATSLATLKLVTLNRLGGKAHFLRETFCWPYYVLERGAKTGWSLVRGSYEIFDPRSGTRLEIQRTRAGLGREDLRLRRWFSFNKSPEGLALRGKFLKDQIQMLKDAEGVEEGRISKEAYKRIVGKAEREFHAYLRKMKPEDVPEWFHKAHQTSQFKDIKIERLDSGQFREILDVADVDDILKSTETLEAGKGAGASGNAADALRTGPGTGAPEAEAPKPGAESVRAGAEAGAEAVRPSASFRSLTSAERAIARELGFQGKLNVPARRAIIAQIAADQELLDAARAGKLDDLLSILRNTDSNQCKEIAKIFADAPEALRSYASSLAKGETTLSSADELLHSLRDPSSSINRAARAAEAAEAGRAAGAAEKAAEAGADAAKAKPALRIADGTQAAAGTRVRPTRPEPDAFDGTAARRLEPAIPEKPPLGVVAAAGEAGEVGRAAKATEVAGDVANFQKAREALLGNKRFLQLLTASGKSVEEVGKILRAAQEAGHLSNDTLIAISHSAKGQELLAGALKAENAAEETSRILAAANAATGWRRTVRIGVNVGGAALDVFAITMAYCDWQANGERIKATNNPALKELYSNANTLYLAEAGTSAAGLVFAGVAVVSAKAAGASLLTALGAPVGAILIVPAALVLGTRYYYNAVEEAAEGYLKTSDDWLKHDSADLLKRIVETGPGESTFGQRIAASDWVDHVRFHAVFTRNGMRDVTFERLEDSNAQMRAEVYRAYFRKTSILDRRPFESEEEYRERSNRFIADQLIYIDRMTGGTFAITFKWQLEDAAHYAELASRARDVQQRLMDGEQIEESDYLFTAAFEDGGTRTLDLREFGKDQSPGKTIEQATLYRMAVTGEREFSEIKETLQPLLEKSRASPELREGLRQILLHKLRHRINKFEAQLRLVDFPGVGNTYESNVVRTYVQRILLARVDRAVNQLIRAVELQQLGTEEMKQEYRRNLHDIHALLDTDPVTIFQKHALPGDKDIGYKKVNELSLPYLVPGAAMMDQIIRASRAT